MEFCIGLMNIRVLSSVMYSTGGTLAELTSISKCLRATKRVRASVSILEYIDVSYISRAKTFYSCGSSLRELCSLIFMADKVN